MAKGKNKVSPAEDYIDQLNWHANHPPLRGGGRSSSIRYEPRWKYKIVYRYPPATILSSLLSIVVFLGIIAGAIFLITSATLTIESKIFIASLSALFIIIIFFAIKDASNDSDNDYNFSD